jgi:hypothetical protein
VTPPAADDTPSREARERRVVRGMSEEDSEGRRLHLLFRSTQKVAKRIGSAIATVSKIKELKRRYMPRET